MFGLCVLVRELLLDTTLSSGWRLLVVIGVGIVGYGLALTWRGRDVIAELRTLRPRAAGEPDVSAAA